MSAATFLEPWQLMAAFARSLSDMYGKEVPAYTTLLDVSHEVNADHDACATRLLWTRVQGGVTRALAGTTLAELVEFTGGPAADDREPAVGSPA